MDVTFSTKKYNGPVRKTVHVLTSDGNNPSYPLQVSALVGGPPATVGVEPAAIDFERFAADAPQQAVITLSNYSPAPMTITIAEGPLDYLDATLSATTLEPRESVELTVKTTKTPPLGRFNSGVTLLLNEATNMRMTIPISGVTMMR